MQLTINGEIHEVQDDLSVADLIQHLNLTDGPVAVERNRQVVPRADHADIRLRAGDILEIVHLVGGG